MHKLVSLLAYNLSYFLYFRFRFIKYGVKVLFFSELNTLEFPKGHF